MNENYPMLYRAFDRESLIDMTPDKRTVVILIHGNIQTGLDNEETYRLARARLPEYADSLTISIDDVERDAMQQRDIDRYRFSFFSLEKAREIDTFLRKHRDKQVYVSCVAGVSRSGGVIWFLDNTHKLTKDWQLKNYGDGFKRPISERFFPNKDIYRYFAELVELHQIALLTPSASASDAKLKNLIKHETTDFPMLRYGLGDKRLATYSSTLRDMVNTDITSLVYQRNFAFTVRQANWSGAVLTDTLTHKTWLFKSTATGVTKQELNDNERVDFIHEHTLDTHIIRTRSNDDAIRRYVKGSFLSKYVAFYQAGETFTHNNLTFRALSTETIINVDGTKHRGLVAIALDPDLSVEQINALGYKFIEFTPNRLAKVRL